MARCAAPIPCGAFSADGNIFAYAVSYDWSKGAEAHQPASAQNSIYLHATSVRAMAARSDSVVPALRTRSWRAKCPLCGERPLTKRISLLCASQDAEVKARPRQPAGVGGVKPR